MSELGYAVAAHLVKSGIIHASAINPAVQRQETEAPLPGLDVSQLHVSPTKTNSRKSDPEEDQGQPSDFVAEFAQAMQSDLQAMSKNNGMSTMQILAGPTTASENASPRSVEQPKETEDVVNRNTGGDRQKLMQAIQLHDVQAYKCDSSVLEGEDEQLVAYIGALFFSYILFCSIP